MSNACHKICSCVVHMFSETTCDICKMQQKTDLNIRKLVKQSLETFNQLHRDCHQNLDWDDPHDIAPQKVGVPIDPQLDDMFFPVFDPCV